MRIKNCPRRQVYKKNDISCIDNRMTKLDSNQWSQLSKTRSDRKYIFEDMYENDNEKKCEPLNLSITNPVGQCKWNDMQTINIDEASKMLISDVPIDLSIKIMSKNLISLRNIHHESTISERKSSDELKNSFLYKMLADSTLNDNTKKLTNEPLDLSISKSLSYCKWNKSDTKNIYDSSSATISNATVDLLINSINKNILPSRNNCKSVLLSTSNKSGELKNSILYKMLTDLSFIDNIKKIQRSNFISCEYCKRDFVYQLDLYNHQNGIIDKVNNNISCCACGEIFSQRRYLRSHQRSHSEKNKFTCDICARQYSRRDNLIRHNTFHTNPDKFRCSYCARTFARKDLLNKHVKRHENKYRYHCDICQKYFKGPLSQENHNRTFHSTI